MIKQLKEFGLIEHWKKIEMDKVAKITQNGDSAAEFKGLTLSNLQARIYYKLFKVFIYPFSGTFLHIPFSEFYCYYHVFDGSGY